MGVFLLQQHSVCCTCLGLRLKLLLFLFDEVQFYTPDMVLSAWSDILMLFFGVEFV